MAGNKGNTKTKGKEDKEKGSNKVIGQSTEDNDDPDFSLLRKPIPSSVTGFNQARKIFDFATEELKGLLSEECDLLYECKVCRSIFRSLLNFISHKRVYCKEKFCSDFHSHFINPSSTYAEMQKLKRMEQDYQESLKENIDNIGVDNEDDDERIPLTKDLTTVIEKISKRRHLQESNCDDPQLNLQKIPNSSVAVYQNSDTSEKGDESMRAQVNELHDIFRRDIAVLQSDGNFKIQSSVPAEPDKMDVIQISDDEDSDTLTCKICDIKFSTQKTFKFHMKNKHVEDRLVYPCPDCLEVFSTAWSVYRHLFKVHRKRTSHIRRLKGSINAKAFKQNNPPPYYEKRKNNMKTAPTPKITEEERIELENQAWMDNIEGDGEVPRCGGCGRSFDRRAALLAHTQTCPARHRALLRRTPETKKIEIQIRPDKVTKEDQPSQKFENITVDNNESENVETVDNEEPNFDIGEDDAKSNNSADSPSKEEIEPIPVDIEAPKLSIKLPFAQQVEKNNFGALKQKIQSDVELKNMLCKLCQLQLKDVQELYDHVAAHYKWVRYACKLCNFKNYYFDKLPEHVRIVHKLKGDNDFYFSTVKAVDGIEALALCENTEEVIDTSETSPDSRRPSRCSSDSGRLSDDSSSSSNRMEIKAKKRKILQSKESAKRKKESLIRGDVQKDSSTSDKTECSSNLRAFEENSSDMDDIEEKDVKKQSAETSAMASRRPVRRKIKPKNEDFEYDLSNLLKMDAQGYRDSQLAINPKSTPIKKKIPEIIQGTHDNLNRDCLGALFTLSKIAVEKSTAQIKSLAFAFPVSQKDNKSNIFVRPFIPKITRGEKLSQVSPIKELVVENDCSSSQLESKPKEMLDESSITVIRNINKLTNEINLKPSQFNDKTSISNSNKTNTISEKIKTEVTLPSIVPLKLRRESMELIKNPIMNKNIADLTKAGINKKILVIKPLNKDGKQAMTAPMKFQTIKLKDPNKSLLNDKEIKQSHQVVVVKVPKVECTISKSGCESNTKIVIPQDKNNTVSNSLKSVDNVENSLNNLVIHGNPVNTVDVDHNSAKLINTGVNTEKSVCISDNTEKSVCFSDSTEKSVENSQDLNKSVLNNSEIEDTKSSVINRPVEIVCNNKIEDNDIDNLNSADTKKSESIKNQSPDDNYVINTLTAD